MKERKERERETNAESRPSISIRISVERLKRALNIDEKEIPCLQVCKWSESDERESRTEEASYQCSSREGGEGRESELTMVVNQWRLSVREA